jgi:DNA-binding MarR family transcriptional regulator
VVNTNYIERGSSRSMTASDEQELIDAIARLSFTTMAVLTKLAADHDLSLTQLRVLGILRDRRLKMSELADYLGLDRSTISGLVERTEKRGLLQRTPHPVDGRSVEVALSRAGREAAARGTAALSEALSPMTSALSRADTQRLTTLIDRLLRQLGPELP